MRASRGIPTEKLWLQDGERDGLGFYERAHIATEHQSPYGVAQVRDVFKMEETTRSIDESDEWRVDDLFDV